ncbi:MAG: hypothetical protein ACKVJK_04275 [Methylophagaceae bacterium]|jgi:hypothetical protein|tara:strand:+ start:931 stop:1155 length:225 start_codon:yes stop_codon:yes gene_type:complete
MDWITRFWKKPEVKQIKQETVVIDMMKDDIDPTALTVENAYKTRWIWYHTILAIGIFMTNMLLLAILLLLAVKL